eukprot:TRINITY_DN2679_c0_g2_i1.p1 TRINITY_DN2679_c0_g2~~TRINITY_DN2679_c0_g2_i1.p1  ORF type:complete len:637 (+),score=142.24 TRINITY_DN2679_c0_g2_i1:57-1967(+)
MDQADSTTNSPPRGGEFSDIANRLKQMEIQQLQDEIGTLKKQLEMAKGAQVRTHNELASTALVVKEQTQKIHELNAVVQDRDHELAQLAEDRQKIGAMKQEQHKSRSEIEALKRQLISMANEASRKQGELQNQLQAYAEFVETLKHEFEQFEEITREESQAIRQMHASEYDRLKIMYEDYKAMHFDDKRRMLREHQEVMYALQSQFDEYRTTAEFLFNTEAAKLEDKLNMQMLKYDLELKYIIKQKDQLYDEMLTAKDAKIMSLMEGLDFATLAQKHDQEMDVERRAHAKELEALDLTHQSALRKLAQQYQRELSAQERALDKAKAQVKTLDARFSEASEQLNQRDRLLDEKERTHTKLSEKWQKIFEEDHKRIESLMQERERLRHRIVRLQLHKRSDQDTSIDAVVQRLGVNTTELTEKYSALTERLDATSAENVLLTERLREEKRKNLVQEHEFAKARTDLVRLSAAFESFLQAKAREHNVSEQTRSPLPVQPPPPFAELKVAPPIARTLSSASPRLVKTARTTSAFEQTELLQLQKGFAMLKSFKQTSTMSRKKLATAHTSDEIKSISDDREFRRRFPLLYGVATSSNFGDTLDALVYAGAERQASTPVGVRVYVPLAGTDNIGASAMTESDL